MEMGTAGLTAEGMLEFLRLFRIGLKFDTEDTSLQTAIAVVSRALTKASLDSDDGAGEAATQAETVMVIPKAVEMAAETLVTLCLKHNGFLRDFHEPDDDQGDWTLIAADVAMLILSYAYDNEPMFQLLEICTPESISPITLGMWWELSMSSFKHCASQLEHDDWTGFVACRITCAIAFMLALHQRGLNLPCGIGFEEYISDPSAEHTLAVCSADAFSVPICIKCVDDEDEEKEKEIEITVTMEELDTRAVIHLPDGGKQRVSGLSWDTSRNVQDSLKTVKDAVTACSSVCFAGMREPFEIGVYHFLVFSAE